MKLLRSFIALISIIILTNHSVVAQTISVSPTQTTNIEKLGWPTNYVITGIPQGLTASNVVWSVKETSPNTSNWFSMTQSGLLNSSMIWSFPSSFQVRAVITYQPTQQNPNPTPVTIVRNVTIAAPIITVISGLDTNTLYNDSDTIPTSTSLNGSQGRYLVFSITLSDGSNPGPYLGVIAQEQITNVYVDGVLQPSNTNWTPLDNNDVRFQIVRNPQTGGVYINDWKTVTIPNGQGSPQPGLLSTYTQSIRLFWNDWTGAPQSSSTITGNYEVFAIDANNWQTHLEGGGP